MSSDSKPPRRLIDTPTKARFVAALRGGARRAEAAAEAGFNLQALYNARARDPLFRSAWLWALELSAADERDARLAASAERWQGVPVRFASQGGRIVQRRRMRWVKFDEEHQQIFLHRLAGTADANEAADVAGVHISTVNKHRRKNPEFATRFQGALECAYPMLETEALRQRLAAQERLRNELMPTGEIAQEFDRVMTLLARWDRHGGKVGVRPAGLRGRVWTFDEAIEALDKKLRAIGVRVREVEERE